MEDEPAPELAPQDAPPANAESTQDAQEGPESDDEAISTPESAEIPFGACPNEVGAPSEDAPETDDSEFEADGWRIESKGAGRFGFRQGGGYQRRTMRGVYLSADQLSEDQREKHKRNAAKQAGAKQHAQQQRGG